MIAICQRLFVVLLFSTWGGLAHAADYQVDTLADGLDHPWSLAFLPNGELLVSERSGQLRRVSVDGVISEPLSGLPPVYAKSQGGLFDVVLHPQFTSNQLLYWSYAQGPAKSNATVISRARLVGNELQQVEQIFAVSPRKDTPVHYGGRMVFLPDGSLLLTSGDGFNFREAAQTLNSQLGKVLRLTDTGHVPADNPFVDQPGIDPYVYSYGHRNPQGLAFDATTQTIYLHEHGPRGGDELNVIAPGNNYGWPAITHGVDYSGAHVSPFSANEGMQQPLTHWTPSIACSGLAIYRGRQFPAWDGHALVGALLEKSVRRVVIEGGRVVNQQTLFDELNQRIRDVRVGPNGLIYLLTDSPQGQILRVSPKDRLPG